MSIRKTLLILSLALTVSVLTGCGGVGLPTSGSDINDLAKQTLPGTWQGDGISFTADENGNITDMDISDALPEELQNIKLDGTPFQIDIPGYKTVTATLSLESATVNEDGSVNIVYKGTVTGGIEGFLASMTNSYVEIDINGQLDDINNPSSMTATATATAHVLGNVYEIATSPEFDLQKIQ